MLAKQNTHFSLNPTILLMYVCAYEVPAERQILTSN